MTKTASLIPRPLLVLLAGGLLGAVFAASPVLAATTGSQGFQVSPPENVLAINPGTSTKQTVKVTNLTNTEMNLTVAKEDFTAQGDLGQISLTEDAGPLFSLAPWFNLSATSVSVPPLGTSSVTYTIAAPVNAEPGGRYGAIVFSTIPPPLPNGVSGAATKSVLASLILLRINGNAKQLLDISSFKPTKSFYQYGPVSFNAIVKNLGNVHERPTGQISIKDMLGLKTDTIAVTPEYVLPTASRQLSATLDRHFMFGRYVATLNLSVPGVQVLSATTSFWVIPYKLVAVVLIIILLLIFFLVRMRKRFARAIRILAGRE